MSLYEEALLAKITGTPFKRRVSLEKLLDGTAWKSEKEFLEVLEFLDWSPGTGALPAVEALRAAGLAKDLSPRWRRVLGVPQRISAEVEVGDTCAGELTGMVDNFAKNSYGSKQGMGLATAGDGIVVVHRSATFAEALGAREGALDCLFRVDGVYKQGGVVAIEAHGPTSQPKNFMRDLERSLGVA